MERGSGGLSDGDLVRALLRLSELSEPPPKGKEEGDERDGGRDGEGALLAVELSALAAERVARGRICSPSALAAVLSCLGNLRVDGNADAQSGRQIGQVLGDALLRLATFGNLPTGIVINGLVSLARMGHYHKQMCAEVETQLADGAIDAFTSQQLANISWAFASMGHQTGDTFDRIAESLLSRWEEGKGGEANSLTLSKLAHSFCKAQHPVPALLDYVAGQVVERTQEFQLKQLALIAWAFAKVRPLY